MLKVLKKCYLFSSFSNMELLKIEKLLNGSITHYKKGDVIINIGDIYKNISIVLDGEFCISQYYENGKEQLIQKAKEAYIIGLEISVNTKNDSPYTVYCTNDGSLYSFSSEILYSDAIEPVFSNLLKKRIIEFLANDNIRKFYKIEFLSISSAREKILKYLNLQKKRFGTSEFSIEYNREELSNYLDLNRSVLSHELKEMEREGLIIVKKNHFKLL